MIIEGNFLNNKPTPNGNFKIKYPNGEVYEGLVSKNKRHGFGKYYYNNGDVYEGNWEKNKKSGKGTFYAHSIKAELSGDFVNDEIVKGKLRD